MTRSEYPLARAAEYPLARAAEYPLARRTVIKGIGAGMAAAGLTGAMRAQAATMDGSEAGDIWSSEYWTKKADIPLWMYRKRIGEPKPGEGAAGRVLRARLVGNVAGVRSFSAREGRIFRDERIRPLRFRLLDHGP